MGAEGALDRLAVDLGGAGPALRRAQDDRRPARAHRGGGAGRPGLGLDRGDPLVAAVERRRELAVDPARVGAADEDRLVAVAGEQLADLLLARPAEHGRPGDLVLVEVEDRQHGAVAGRVEEAHPLPGALQRPGLRLAVADHAGDQQVWVVEGGAEGVDEGVAELAALVDRARRRHADVAGDPARGRELADQAQQPRLVGGDLGVELRVGALEVGVGHHRRPAVAGTGDEEDLLVAAADQPVELGIDEVEAGRGAPVAEQARLDVLGPQRLPQQRVGLQVDLGDGQVVGRLPVAEQPVQLRFAQFSHGLKVEQAGNMVA